MFFQFLDHRTQVTSTNDVMQQALLDGCAHGCAVYADEQTAGRGRHGRSWHSPPGTNLYLSVALRGQQWRPVMSLLPLAAGVAAVEAIERECGVQVGIKWPNDLLVDGRKLGGILCEAVSDRSGIIGVVVGIGVNVNLTAESLPEELRDTACSLLTLTGASQDVPRLAASFRRLMLDHADQLLSAQAGALVEQLREHDCTVGRVVEHGEYGRGTALRIADDGALVVAFDGPGEIAVRSGEVRFLPA